MPEDTTTVEQELEPVVRELSEINGFIRDKFDPESGEVTLVRQEVDRVAAAIVEVQGTMREMRRGQLLRETEEGARISPIDGPYTGLDVVDLGILRGFAHSQRRESFGPAWIERVNHALGQVVEGATGEALDALTASYDKRASALAAKNTGFNPAMYMRNILNREGAHIRGVRAAMDSVTAGSGDELVATLQARELWMDVNLQTLVASNIPVFPMPSNPFDIPRQLGDVNFYPGTENIATTSTALGTGRTTLTAFEIVGQVPFSFTLEEDAIIAMLPEIRAGLVRNIAEVMDDLILNADTTAANGINSDGVTITKGDAGKGHWLIGYDGLIHLPLVDNTALGNDHNAAVSDDMFNEIRAKLGKYGVRPSQLMWVMDVNTYIRAQSISNFRTMDKLGVNATLLSGMLGAVEGIPVIVSEQMKLADTDGKVTDAGNGTDTGRLLIVNRSQWAQGFRRDMTIDVDRDTQKRQTVVTVSFRHALSERSGTRSSATHTGLQFDVTGV